MPLTWTRRHSSAAVGAELMTLATSRAVPSTTSCWTRIRGASYARVTVPVTRTRMPARSVRSAVPRYSSIAPVASSTTARRPVPSSSIEPVVSAPSTETTAPSRSRAVAIGSRGAAAGDGEPDADGDGAGDADGDPIGETSARSRSQSRYPSSAFFREARWPMIPVNDATRPLRRDRMSRPADPSAATRRVRPSSPVITRARSPPVDLTADTVILPRTVTRRPSVVSPAAPASITGATGSVAVPTIATPPDAARSSVCPYGFAMVPRTSTSVPRAGPAKPDDSRTGSPPVRSPMTNTPGMPRRPDSAITTPRTTVRCPTGTARAAATSTAPGTGLAVGDGVGEGDGVGAGVGVGVGWRTASGRWASGSGSARVGDGVGDGASDGSGVGLGVGVGGAGGATTSSSPNSVA